MRLSPSPRRAAALACAAALAAALAGWAPDARATGMQGHMYVSEVALSHLPQGDLKALLQARRDAWLNGSFFPDSGYAANDPYGEMAHWEQFVEAYLQWIRASYEPPFTTGPAADHVAVLMGVASHSMVDQVFDSLFMAKVDEMDGDTDDLDTGIDTWIVVDLDRKENPEVVIDAQAMSEVFSAGLAYEVSPATILGGMDTAKMAIGGVITVLASGHQKFRDVNPWGSKHYLSEDVPGAYPHCAEVTARYWQSLWRRLQGDESFGDALVGVTPGHGARNVAVAHDSVDGRVTLFFGYGLDRDSVTDTSIVVQDEQGQVVPTSVSMMGDAWAGTVKLTPLQDWSYRSIYTVRVTTQVATLYGTHPDEDLVSAFTTACAPDDESCAPDASNGEGGCSVGRVSSDGWAWLSLLALGVLASRRSRRVLRSRN